MPHNYLAYSQRVILEKNTMFSITNQSLHYAKLNNLSLLHNIEWITKHVILLQNLISSWSQPWSSYILYRRATYSLIFFFPKTTALTIYEILLKRFNLILTWFSSTSYNSYHIVLKYVEDVNESTIFFTLSINRSYHKCACYDILMI